MKKTILLLSAALFVVSQIPAQAQMGRPGNSPTDNIFAKVFGTNLDFSANMETDIQMPGSDSPMILTGKIYFSDGNSRTEMDMTKMHGGKMPPHLAKQLKSMGMDRMVSIYRNDTKTIYMIYPGLDSYAKLETPQAQQGTNDTSKVKKVELGKERVNSHPCLKNQYTITGTKNGHDTVLIAWLATDLSNYPIKIEMNPAGKTKVKSAPTTTITFTGIDTTKPAASLFEPPTGYRVYTDMRAMMQTEMMRKMGGSMRMPPNHTGMPAGHPDVTPKHP